MTSATARRPVPARTRTSFALSAKLLDDIVEAADEDQMDKGEWIELTLRNEIRRRKRRARNSGRSQATGGGE